MPNESAIELATSNIRCGFGVMRDVLCINVGVAAPMEFFPFSGWKESFFGDLHAQGRDGVQFFTQEKVVVERWSEEWSKKL